MRRSRVAGMAVAGVVGLAVLTIAAGPAAAKGPMGATIEGDGLAAPIEHSAVGGSKLADLTGLFVVISGGAGRELTADPPTDDLGPELVVTWDMGSYTDESGAVHDKNLIRQEVYPYAAGGPLAHTRAGQRFFASDTGGGWFAAPEALTDMLRSLGVPGEAQLTEAAAPPAPPAAVRDAGPATTGDGPWPAPGWAVALPAAVAAAIAVLARRRVARA